MPRWQGIDPDRVLAWCCLLVAHLIAWWWLTRPHAVPQPAIGSDGLDVVWIEPVLPQTPKQMPIAGSPRPSSSAPNSVRDDTPRRDQSAPVALPIADPPAEPETSRPLSAVFLEQGRAWAQTQHQPDDFARNPLTRRTVPRADERRDRFVMREPITPASVVAGIGELFGGPGYTTDPCPRIRDNITNLATGGESAPLDEELRRDRRLCR
jgi:hypothetical protein